MVRYPSRLLAQASNVNFERGATWPRLSPSRQPCHGGDQLGGIDRLGEMGLEARLQGALPVLGPRVGGERRGGDVAAVARLAGAHLADERVAVLEGHADVGDQ